GSAQDLFLPALRNSIGITLIATLIAVILATLCAYAIARLDFPGKRLILTTALAVSIFPVISVVTPLFNLWRNIGLYDTWPGLIIPYLSLTVPISIWTLSAYFREIPWDLERAAQVDGATTWQAFRKVIVPLALPGVFTTALISFFIAWNDFVYGISLTSTEAPPRAGRVVLLHRGFAVRGSGRGHRCGRGDRDHPRRAHRVVVPAADRFRPHPGCGQGLSVRSRRGRSVV
ncbi:MAG TPA: carbohydrate ABC transporter permease, partial [Jiangellaceae bacterium]|nr:carbohydrate ABC transporter permease [Jiangellaceae bacterium]